jgi:hypothetical protein
MKMTSKFFKTLSIILALVALAMTLYGFYFLITHRLSSNYPTCEATASCAPVAGIVMIYVTLVLGAIGFSGLTYFHSREIRKREERNRRR